ncbi:hypothetical protein LPJ56_007001 [Coemansia sp. RSA 2599]|nr:hypothetical protein LPJ75_007055 [Coemansia sp. RSA 2598]KAJ1803258.1 hypothetical protein LPJ56_007001 [Coemansia sp. RSA 2599]
MPCRQIVDMLQATVNARIERICLVEQTCRNHVFQCPRLFLIVLVKGARQVQIATLAVIMPVVLVRTEAMAMAMAMAVTMAMTVAVAVAVTVTVVKTAATNMLTLLLLLMLMFMFMLMLMFMLAALFAAINAAVTVAVPGLAIISVHARG